MKLRQGLFFCAAGILLAAPAAPAQRVVPLKFLFRTDTTVALRHPRAIAVDPLGNLYVADTGNHRIVWFGPEGKFVRYLGGLGGGREQFDTPTDVCAPDGLNLFVVDQNNNRIVRLDRRLNFVAAYAGRGFRDEIGRFALPAGIAVSPQGDLFLSEEEQNGIIKFNAFLQPVSRFGGLQSGETVLSRPEQLAVLGNRWLVVVDRDAERLALFDYFGNFIRFFPDSLVRQPQGLASVPGDTSFLVTDSARNAVLLCSADGVLARFRTLSTDPGQTWRTPTDVAMSGNRLFVLDAVRGSVLVYGLFPPKR